MAAVEKISFDELLSSVKKTISFHQPFLVVENKKSEVTVKGRFLLHESVSQIDPRGPLTEYELEIFVPRTYPRKQPIVFETGGKIPRIDERHINGRGDCCILVWDHWLLTTEDASFSSYFSGPLHDYFLGQHHFELFGKWPFGERAHGYPGLVEAYVETIGFPELPSNQRALKQILKLLSQDWPKGHWPCPCGSNKKLRNCHRKELEDIHRRIPPAMAVQMLENIKGI